MCVKFTSCVPVWLLVLLMAACLCAVCQTAAVPMTSWQKRELTTDAIPFGQLLQHLLGINKTLSGSLINTASAARLRRSVSDRGEEEETATATDTHRHEKRHIKLNLRNLDKNGKPRHSRRKHKRSAKNAHRVTPESRVVIDSKPVPPSTLTTVCDVTWTPNIDKKRLPRMLHEAKCDSCTMCEELGGTCRPTYKHVFALRIKTRGGTSQDTDNKNRVTSIYKPMYVKLKTGCACKVAIRPRPAS
jgi:hypothetical protein